MKIVSAGMHTIIMPRTKTQQIRQMLSVLRFLNRKSIYIKTQSLEPLQLSSTLG